MAARTWGDPIFIGGPSRSGTTMISQMLGAHPAIHVTRETHYFDDLRSKIRGESLAALEPAARDKALDYFRALSDRPYGLKG